MSTTNRKSSFERSSITYGAALSVSIFALLAPNMVMAQVLPEELEEPVRMQMLPICGKIEAQPATIKPAITTSQTVSRVTQIKHSAQSIRTAGFASGESQAFAHQPQFNIHSSESETPSVQPSVSVHKVAKLPVGTFNQTQHVKEFSWLSDDATVEAATADTESTTGKAGTSLPKPTKYSTGTSSIQKSATKARSEKIVAPTSTAESDDDIEQPVEKIRDASHAKVKVTTKNSETEKAAQSAETKKEHNIDPDSVKVARKPHCSGVADYYADQFHGRKTASGQLHDRNKFTAAHRTLPFGTKLKVVNRNTGKACVVTVNDRGPFTKARIIDLSSAAAKELGLMTAKSRLVDCYIVENE